MVMVMVIMVMVIKEFRFPDFLYNHYFQISDIRLLLQRPISCPSRCSSSVEQTDRSHEVSDVDGE